MKKYIKMLFVGLVCLLFLAACGSSGPKADYTTKEAEQTLNDGKSIEGKTVEIKVDKLVPDSAFGYNIQTGDHLNFVSSENPNVKEGETLIVKVTSVKSVMGSYVINYEVK